MARTLVLCCRKSRQNSNGVTPNGGAKCRWGRLNAGAIAADWRLSTQNVVIVNLARSQVYHTERPPYLFAARSPHDAARRAGLSATADLCRYHNLLSTKTPPVEAHRPVITYLQFPIQVCFSVDHAQPATPLITDNFRRRQPYGLNSSIDTTFFEQTK